VSSSIASWDEVAPLWGEGDSPFRHISARLVRWANIEEGARVVDLGCGNGLGLQELLVSPRSGSLVGVDFSREMLARSHTRVGLETIPLVRADVRALPFAAESFDVALAASVFQFVSYSVDALREWRRILASPGRLVYSIPVAAGDDVADVNMTLLREFFPRLSEDVQTRLRAMPPPAAQPPDLVQACLDAGFRDAVVDEFKFDTTLPNLDDWWDLQWTHGFRGFLREVDEANLVDMKARAFELLQPRVDDAGRVVGTQVTAYCSAHT
jgi:SAM-dependent methyltransferase